MIPARYAATRFPAKLMQMLGDKTVILHTYNNTVATNLFDEVMVVTDSEIIFNEITSHGGKAVMSIKEHESGSDRIALTAAIRMVQELASLGASRFDGAAQGLAHQLRGQGRAQRPTDDFAAKQIDHHRQVNPACGRRQVRDVGHPLAVGGVGREVLSQFVRSRLLCGVGLSRRGLERLADTTGQAQFPHRGRHGVATHGLQLVTFAQDPGHLVTAVGAVRLGMDLLHGLSNALVPVRTQTGPSSE